MQPAYEEDRFCKPFCDLSNNRLRMGSHHRISQHSLDSGLSVSEDHTTQSQMKQTLSQIEEMIFKLNTLKKQKKKESKALNNPEIMDELPNPEHFNSMI
jgi:hypothetical protein